MEALTQATILAPGDPLSQGYRGWALGLAGQRQEARVILGNLARRRTDEYFSGFLMAHVSLGLGDQEQAISWLQKAAEERDALLPYLNEWFAFDALRADPRVHALLHRATPPETRRRAAANRTARRTPLAPFQVAIGPAGGT